MKHTEDALQMDAARYLSAALPDTAFWWHCPNGGRRGAREGGRFKLMGVKAGVPDIALLFAGKTYFIELKSPTGRLSPAQKALHPVLARAGSPVAVCTDIRGVEAVLRGWEIPVKARVT